MKVLFVSSGNNKYFPIAPFIKSQGDSLIKQGIEVEYFKIKGKGIIGYIKNIPRLRSHLKRNKYDVIHAHYGLCGWVVLLAKKKTAFGVSFMGDDLKGGADSYGKNGLIDYPIILLSLILQIFVDFIIVKSANLANVLKRKKNVFLIPNGIDIKHFYPVNKNISRKKIGIDESVIAVLFLGNKLNSGKNYKLVRQAIRILDKDIAVIAPYPVDHRELIFYYNSADVFILSSYKEGSPNVIKEAMACNCPIVSTDVGDVKLIIRNTEGCYMTNFNPRNVARNIYKALDFAKINGRTKGRNRIITLGLDTDSIAKKIVNVYQTVLDEKKCAESAEL